jgi:cytochrome c556
MSMRARPSKTLLAGGALAVAAILGASIAEAVNEPEHVINYRKATMRAIGGHMAALATVVRGEVGFVDEVALHAQAINDMSQNLLRLFPEGTGREAGETRALPGIWQEWHDFETIVAGLQELSGDLAEAAQAGDMDAVRQRFAVLGREGCTACHERFRAEET